jgi:hemin transport system ATP-binding protein
VTTTVTAAALDAQHVSKVYGAGHTALDAVTDVSLRLVQGEFLGLVGPSGSGKTTLLSLIGALLTPTQGSIRIGDTDVTALSRRARTAFRARRIGFVFQSFNLVPFLTARQNLAMMASLSGHRDRARIGSREAGIRADQILDELGLSGRGHHLPEQLSGGERQRVAIGRALFNDPSLILVDEPTANLDTERGQQIVQLLAREVRRRGKAGIMVTHDPRILAHTDRTLAMLDGRLVAAP